ncbi:MAG: hypothetical protein R3A11_00225 [Bdellovibrionota bacterium]
MSDQDILDGMYRYQPASIPGQEIAYLFGSSVTVNESLQAQKILENSYKIPCEVWSITSYKNLHQDALNCERWNAFAP